jgi:cytochrome c553
VNWQSRGAACALVLLAFCSSTVAPALAEDAIGGDMIVTKDMKPWEGCGECHDLDGVAPNGHFPNLAGQKTAYFLKAMEDFRTGRRANDHGQMGVSARETTGKALDQVAAYFASLPPPAPQPNTELAPAENARAQRIVERGDRAAHIPACDDCHGPKPKHEFVAPCLEAQQAPYLEKQLDDFTSGRRTDDPDQIMQKIAKRLPADDVHAVSVYLAGLARRGAACGAKP